MATIDKIKLNNTTYDIAPDTLETVNANAYGLNYIHMRSGEEQNIPLLSATSGGSIELEETLITTLINLIYPIGSIYISVNSTNPSLIFGGTWEAFGTGRTLIGVDASDTSFNTVEKTGGSKTHTHGLTNAYSSFMSSGTTAKWNEVNTGISQTTNYYGTFSSKSTASNTTTWGSKLFGSTDSASSLQPYITTYMWKRTA